MNKLLLSMLTLTALTTGTSLAAGLKSWDAELGVQTSAFSLSSLETYQPYGYVSANYYLTSLGQVDLWLVPEVGHSKMNYNYASITANFDTPNFSIPLQVEYDFTNKKTIYRLGVRFGGEF